MSRQITQSPVGIVFFLILTGLFLSPGSTLFAQGSVDIGATTTSRYVWRGMLFDNGVNFQPYAMYSTEKFSVGAASSMSLTNDFNEISFWMSYKMNTPIVDMTFYLNDYYYEYLGSDFFNYDDANEFTSVGSHYLEAYVVLSKEDSPFSFLFSSVFWNDPDRSLYAEASYSTTLKKGLESTFSLGSALTESREWYFTQKTGIVNVSYELSKSLEISPQFSIPMSVKTILNPYGRNFYVVLSLSI
jgi:hypothetical protein